MRLVVRGLSLCVCAVLLTGQALPSSPAEPDDFCARLGRTLGIEKIEVTDGKSAWSANALNFGQRVLFGGSAVTTLATDPLEPATVEDYQRSADMCRGEDEGAVCRLVGPMSFEFTWKGTKSVVPINAGEQAVVKVKSTRAWCWSGVSEPAS